MKTSQNAKFKDLTPIFRRKKRIAAVYLFGSTATGKDRRGSDLDLVVFGQAAPLLQHQILKYGRLICENDPAERVRQEVRARAEYLDTRRFFREIQ